MIPNNDHVNQAIAALFSQYRKPKIEALLTSYVIQIQEIEDALNQVGTVLDLLNASDAQLDLVGVLLNEPRAGMNDDDYRVILRGKIASSRSKGTADDLLILLRILLGSGPTFSYEEFQPAAIHITAPTELPSNVNIESVHRLMQRAKAAGVRLLLIYSEETPVFGFSTDPDAAGFDVGALAGVI